MIVQGHRTYVIFRIKRAVKKIRISARLAVPDARQDVNEELSELGNKIHDLSRSISFGEVSPEINYSLLF